ncbi:succinate dehydrogenase cytochrome b558 subunit [Polycladomyces subterraneus]|uniref:Succinate dehydrogenase cytochrome b558 subunit n=1 Tax=Polycladomyces subterraneus TaxID=1016997 RepID=A0ABT8IIR1_9BACL|nr:succinate dehydrogenase cytochrome b558 subunit [Polycladomyces subterraneus]MDN4592633.1 succinate dehydrogenase cytochrome b558 subunit [Polycladomyces subterraneus]
MSNHSSFFNRRLHSLLGVIPVGFFLVEHLLTNYFATRGPAVFQEKVEWIWNLPFLLALETVFIYLPLLYHALYGLHIAFQAKNNVVNHGTFRNYMFMLQRVTGVITLIFVGWHVWESRIQVALHHWTPHELTVMMHQILSNNVNFGLYLIGVVAAVFHFSNGIWSFLVSWGITVGPRAQYVSTWVCAVIFLVVSYIGISALFAFHNPEFLNQLAQR